MSNFNIIMITCDSCAYFYLPWNSEIPEIERNKRIYGALDDNKKYLAPYIIYE